jgi:hypothetical protein
MLQTWGPDARRKRVSKWRGVESNEAFLHSAKLMRQYMTHAGGLRMLNHHIKDLFNSDLCAQKQFACSKRCR